VEVAAARLITALIAIHALSNDETSRLLLEDMNLPRGRMIVPSGYGRRRTVFLDDLTRGLLDQWLKYRAERWPRSLNPHLLITQQTAVTDEPIRPAPPDGRNLQVWSSRRRPTTPMAQP
jgi:integrase